MTHNSSFMTDWGNPFGDRMADDEQNSVTEVHGRLH